MKKYIAKTNTQVRSVYGPFNLVKGQEVPDYIGKLFTQHVDIINVEEVTTVVVDSIEEEPEKELIKKGKK